MTCTTAQDFINLCTENLQKIRIVLVLGVCTSDKEVHRVFNSITSVNVKVCSFELPDPESQLHKAHR